MAFRAGDILKASDGLVEGSSGTFGWVIALASTGCRLVENSGWVRGGDPSSFRAEIVGGLSVCRYLVRIVEYFNITQERESTWHCDSESS